MREKKVSHKQFCEIFTQRVFSKRDLMMKSIYFIEDDDGNFRIEERNSFTSKVLVVFLFIPLLVCSIVWFGVKCIPEYFRESYAGFTNKHCRVDTCYHGVDSTNKLINLVGWD